MLVILGEETQKIVDKENRPFVFLQIIDKRKPISEKIKFRIDILRDLITRE